MVVFFALLMIFASFEEILNIAWQVKVASIQNI